jgi:glycosyltransferase involved in cell wall biosynthesis
VRAAALVVGQHEAAADELRTLASRVAVLPNPVAAVGAPALNGNAAVVFTGRLGHDKDLAGLLRAWRDVVALDPSARLELVGDAGRHEPAAEELRAMVASDEQLQRTVTFTGWVSDVGPYLAMADVFVLPTIEEGMSNSLLEACAYGRVIVASRIPANVAVLGDGHPLWFTVGNHAELTEALLRAMRDESARSSARAGALEAASRLTPERVIGAFEALLRDAAPASRHPPDASRNS